MHEPRLTVTYRPELVAPVQTDYSRSPLKPALWMKHVAQTSLASLLDVDARIAPIGRRELQWAHTDRYVTAFLSGKPRALAASGGNGWSPGYRDSVLMKVGALVHACEVAVQRPQRVVVCPTSGDHHARPDRGAGYCPVAGQVVAALALFAKHGKRTAWIDLDEHYGNSIPDCAEFNPAVAEAISFNVNPQGCHAAYLADLRRHLAEVEAALVAREVEVVCVGHGADSHEWDELGGSVTTEQWVQAARETYGMVRRASATLGRPVPVVIAFFGGYRDDDYTSVLELHTADVATALDTLADTELSYFPTVRRRTLAV
ncbi:MAG: hypothetical protein KUG77_10145 [Nannocystaceae bacterium]|nr:hypothetical protein [Nannocystaceae bacterium]